MATAATSSTDDRSRVVALEFAIKAYPGVGPYDIVTYAKLFQNYLNGND